MTRTNQDCVEINTALQELTKGAFTVWIGLMAMSAQQLMIGKKKLAGSFKYTEVGFHLVLKELYDKGYIKYDKGAKVGDTTTILIHKRALITGINHFMVLNSSKFKPRKNDELLDIRQSNSDDDGDEGACECDIDEDGYIIDGSSDKKMARADAKELKPKVSTEKKKRRRKKTKVIMEKPLPPSSSPSPCTPSPNNNPPPVDSSLKAKGKGYSSPSVSKKASPLCVRRARGSAILESEEIPRETPPRAADTKLSKNMVRRSKAAKAKVSKKASETAKQTWARRKNPPPKNIDFGNLDEDFKLDANGKPVISFDVNSPLRKGLLKVLNRTEKHPKYNKKLALMKKLKQEISRIYKTYMKMFWVSKGNKLRTLPDFTNLCEKYAANIGANCLQFGITPRQLLEYWDERILNFADKKMKYPPLYLLSSQMAAESTAAALFEETQGGQKKWRSGDFKHKEVAHSFSDTSKIHPGLRSGLIEAGFSDVRQLTDRYLMTVQSTAMALAAGKNIFVGGSMRDYAVWASKHLEW